MVPVFKNVRDSKTLRSLLNDILLGRRKLFFYFHYGFMFFLSTADLLRAVRDRFLGFLMILQELRPFI